MFVLHFEFVACRCGMDTDEKTNGGRIRYRTDAREARLDVLPAWMEQDCIGTWSGLGADLGENPEQ